MKTVQDGASPHPTTPALQAATAMRMTPALANATPTLLLLSSLRLPRRFNPNHLQTGIGDAETTENAGVTVKMVLVGALPLEMAYALQTVIATRTMPVLVLAIPIQLLHL
jgi:hypothetical protein